MVSVLCFKDYAWLHNKCLFLPYDFLYPYNDYFKGYNLYTILPLNDSIFKRYYV